MKMSTRGRYGLRVMMELATHYGKGPISADVIAKNQDITENYIHVLITGLRSAGLVRALRGPYGGYELVRKPAEISALDVVAALEGRCAPVDCVADPAACTRSERCAARDVWREVAAAVDGVLANLTLEQLAERQSRKPGEVITYDI